MPSHGLLGVVGQINPLERHGDPIGDVREVASMESRDRVESLGGFEIAAAQEKDQLIARRAQARGDVLERRGEAVRQKSRPKSKSTLQDVDSPQCVFALRHWPLRVPRE